MSGRVPGVATDRMHPGMHSAREAGSRGRDPRVVREDEEAATRARAERRAAAAIAWKAGTSTYARHVIRHTDTLCC